MPKVTLGEVLSLGEVLTTYMWDFQIIRPPAIPGTNPLELARMRIKCVSFEIPTKDNQVIELTIHNHRFIQPGPNNFNGSISLEFVESSDAGLIQFMEKWINSLFDVYTGLGLPKAVATADIMLTLLNRQGMPVRFYTLYNAFPQSFTAGSLSGEGGDAVRPSATFSYEYFVSAP